MHQYGLAQEVCFTAYRSALCLPVTGTSVLFLVYVLLTLFCFSSSHLFIWQAHNALFIICCLLKELVCQMSGEELQLQFTYEERNPGSYGKYLTSQMGQDLYLSLLCKMLKFTDFCFFAMHEFKKDVGQLTSL